jgi:hypothetical protein
LAPHRSRIGVPSPLLGLANLRLVESAPDGDAEHVLDMFNSSSIKTVKLTRPAAPCRCDGGLCIILYYVRFSIGVGWS